MALISLRGARDTVGRAIGVVLLSVIEVFIFLSTPDECSKFTIGIRILWFEFSIQLGIWDKGIIE